MIWNTLRPTLRTCDDRPQDRPREVLESVRHGSHSDPGCFRVHRDGNGPGAGTGIPPQAWAESLDVARAVHVDTGPLSQASLLAIYVERTDADPMILCMISYRASPRLHAPLGGAGEVHESTENANVSSDGTPGVQTCRSAAHPGGPPGQEARGTAGPRESLPEPLP